MLLSTWLQQIAALNQQTIRLGLERIAKVAKNLGIHKPKAHCITVAGTNGKGSTVATLEQIYLSAGYRVGVFTSPYLFRYTEQIRINGVEVGENKIIHAFECIESMRDSILLTPFEWLTLAALIIFQAEKLDIIILEVGLGGRLDATNVVDTDVAIITSISLDHCEYLGSSRNSIGYEKAGILRPNTPAIYGELDIPESILEYAHKVNAPLFRQGKEFKYDEDLLDWSWQAHFPLLNPELTSEFKVQFQKLPYNGLYPQNLSTALMAVVLFLKRFPVSEAAIRKGILQTQLAGRIECVEDPCSLVYDVAHNPAACEHLANAIGKMSAANHVGVFSMLKDKDIVKSLQAMRGVIHTWHVAPLTNDRAASLEALQEAFEEVGILDVRFYSNLLQAFQGALQEKHLMDRLIIFGSFHTVAAVKQIVADYRANA